MQLLLAQILVTVALLQLRASHGATSEAKITVVVTTPCGTNPFSGMACEGVRQASAKFIEDNITMTILDGTSVCPDFLRSGDHPYHAIVFVGFDLEDCAVEAAALHPGTWISTIDFCPANEHPNILCATFSEDQPAYVAGYLAGLVSKSKTAGIVGGVPVPAVQKLFNGFLLGVKASCPECKIEGVYVNSFYHPDNGHAVADYLVTDMGADVVFGCGGGTGTEAIKRATMLGSMVVGVDSDEFLHSFDTEPDAQRKLVITSVLKKVDTAVLTMITLLKFPLGSQEVLDLGGSMRFDYTNKGVGIADCHLACERIGHSKLSQTARIENRLASTEISVGLLGTSVPIFPEAASSANMFAVAPYSATPPAPRIQAAMGFFNAVFVDFVVAFGGRGETGDFFNDLWLYNKQSGNWLNANHGYTHGSAPPALTKSCVVSVGLSVLIFGGRDSQGQQSKETYAFTYQPTFLGFSDSTNPAIRHEWSHLNSVGEVPTAVEGVACTRFHGNCGIAFGGRAKFADRDTLHQFCMDGGNVSWKELIPVSVLNPSARENAGVAVMDASTLGQGVGSLLVMVGGIASDDEAVALSDAWVLNLTTIMWTKLPDLPMGLTRPLVFEALAADGISKVLTVQSSDSLDEFGLGAFTFDWQRQKWNIQIGNIEGLDAVGMKQTSLVYGGGLVWGFGGIDSGTYKNRMIVSNFAVKAHCSPGHFSLDVGCEECPIGTFSLGGIGVSCARCEIGSFAKQSGSSECLVCDIGRFSDQGGMSECKLCDAGRYKQEGSGPCENCPYGTYGLQVGSGSVIECLQCKPGRYTANKTGVSSESDCVACEPGRALRVPFGKEKCDDCSEGKYSSMVGATECHTCSVGAWQSLVGRTACRQCSPSLTTAYVGATSDVDCICVAGTYRPQDATPETCLSCPGGMVCQVGSDSSDLFDDTRPSPMLKEGFMSRLEDPLLVYKCDSKQHCPGGRPGVCADHMDPEAVACGKCMGNAYETSTKCEPCSNGGSDVLPVVMAIIVGICAVCFATIAVNRNPVMQANSVMLVVILVSMVFSSMQALGVLDQLLLTWFEPANSIMRLLSVLSFDLKMLKLQCVASVDVVSNYLCRQLIAPMIIPFAVVTLALKKARIPQTKMMVELSNSIGTIFNVFFISIVVSSVTPLICYEHPDPNGLSSMVKAPSILCFQGDHISMVVLGIVGFCIVPLPFLCVSLYFIHAYPSCVQGNTTNAELKLQSWRFFFIRFNPERYYYGGVILVRNLSLCLVPVIIQNDVGLQICMMVMVLGTFVVLQQQSNPWRPDTANVMDACLNMALILLLVCGAVGVDLETNATKSTEVVGALCFVVALVALVVVSTYAVSHKLFPRPYYQRFICHDARDAAAQVRFLKMSLVEHTGTSVFTDSDHTGTLDSLLDTVRCSVGKLIVYLTRETLTKARCSGEIVTAFVNKVSVLRVDTASFEASHEDRLEFTKVDSVCTFNISHLDFAITNGDVSEAYAKLLSADTPSCALDKTIRGTERFEHLVNSVLKKEVSCIEMKSEVPDILGAVVLSADPANDESCASAAIMVRKLQKVAPPNTDFVCLVDYEYNQSNMNALTGVVVGARAVIVILSEWSLYSPPQVECILALMSEVSIKSSVIPVCTAYFRFPSEEYYSCHLPALVGISDDSTLPLDLEKITPLIQAFLTIDTIDFLTFASDRLVDRRCISLISRLRFNFDLDAAKERVEKRSSVNLSGLRYSSRSRFELACESSGRIGEVRKVRWLKEEPTTIANTKQLLWM